MSDVEGFKAPVIPTVVNGEGYGELVAGTETTPYMERNQDYRQTAGMAFSGTGSRKTSSMSGGDGGTMDIVNRLLENQSQMMERMLSGFTDHLEWQKAAHEEQINQLVHTVGQSSSEAAQAKMDPGLARYRGSALQPLIPRDVKLPKFDGSMGVEVKLFLDELHHMKCTHGVDDTQILIYVRQLL